MLAPAAVLAPAVLARMIPANLRSEISLIPANATAGLSDARSRPMPGRLLHPTKYAYTADLSHVTMHGQYNTARLSIC
jgi:hypothetical protein